MSIGPLIKDLREAAGLSQSELADVLCDLSSRPTVTRETVSRWENGKRKPAFWLPFLALALNVPLSVLEFGEVRRRTFVVGTALGALSPMIPPTTRNTAAEIVTSIASGDPSPLATVQTSHETDLLISHFASQDMATVRHLVRWLDEGPPVLRVNACGIVAKTSKLDLIDSATHALRRDAEVRDLYMWAVGKRVGDNPKALIKELYNPKDAGARWCSAMMLRQGPAELVTPALRAALRSEPIPENIRTIGLILNGADPCI
ncbi:helix-turn-helix domain-containing protein [Sphaerisporangium rubeum]|uniref:Transcriptional regulator with XRE-family HTH domain n=1 Tax=Sphaerisporangium rubeum TaxID=321317 RepID=A0A7X0IA21_9ACTN|nr:transcriptional regulator with XRE-family HTH domain [Sphaerisporangium rubeum]